MRVFGSGVSEGACAPWGLAGTLPALLSMAWTARMPSALHFSPFLLCQGDRGLDGFPGKRGDTGEQVGEHAPEGEVLSEDRTGWGPGTGLQEA